MKLRICLFSIISVIFLTKICLGSVSGKIVAEYTAKAITSGENQADASK